MIIIGIETERVQEEDQVIIQCVVVVIEMIVVIIKIEIDLEEDEVDQKKNIDHEDNDYNVKCYSCNNLNLINCNITDRAF